MCLGRLCKFGTGAKSSADPMLTCLATTNPYSKPTRCPFGGAGALAAASVQDYAQFATAPLVMQLHNLLMGTSSFSLQALLKRCHNTLAPFTSFIR